jgi:hypothetical protein
LLFQVEISPAETGQLGEAEDKALAAALDQFANHFQPTRKAE